MIKATNLVSWYITECEMWGSAFSALTLLVGRQEGHLARKKTAWWGAAMVICVQQGADLHMAQLMPLPLTVSCFSKIQIGSTFWYRLTWVVPDKGPLNGCVCVCAMWGLSAYTASLPSGHWEIIMSMTYCVICMTVHYEYSGYQNRQIQ